MLWSVSLGQTVPEKRKRGNQNLQNLWLSLSAWSWSYVCHQCGWSGRRQRLNHGVFPVINLSAAASRRRLLPGVLRGPLPVVTARKGHPGTQLLYQPFWWSKQETVSSHKLIWNVCSFSRECANLYVVSLVGGGGVEYLWHSALRLTWD